MMVETNRKQNLKQKYNDFHNNHIFLPYEREEGKKKERKRKGGGKRQEEKESGQDRQEKYFFFSHLQKGGEILRSQQIM